MKSGTEDETKKQAAGRPVGRPGARQDEDRTRMGPLQRERDGKPRPDGQREPGAAHTVGEPDRTGRCAGSWQRRRRSELGRALPSRPNRQGTQRTPQGPDGCDSRLSPARVWWRGRRNPAHRRGMRRTHHGCSCSTSRVRASVLDAGPGAGQPPNLIAVSRADYLGTHRTGSLGTLAKQSALYAAVEDHGTAWAPWQCVTGVAVASGRPAASPVVH